MRFELVLFYDLQNVKNPTVKNKSHLFIQRPDGFDHDARSDFSLFPRTSVYPHTATIFLIGNCVGSTQIIIKFIKSQFSYIYKLRILLYLKILYLWILLYRTYFPMFFLFNYYICNSSLIIILCLLCSSIFK